MILRSHGTVMNRSVKNRSGNYYLFQVNNVLRLLLSLAHSSQGHNLRIISPLSCFLIGRHSHCYSASCPPIGWQPAIVHCSESASTVTSGQIFTSCILEIHQLFNRTLITPSAKYFIIQIINMINSNELFRFLFCVVERG